MQEKSPPLDDEDEAEVRDDDAPILDMEEYVDPERPKILFRTAEQKKKGEDPSVYEIRVPEDMGVAEEQAFRTELREYAELSAPGKLTKADRAKLQARLDHLFGRVIIAPPAIREAFTDSQKKRVIKTFQLALLTEDAAGVTEALTIMQTPQARDSSTTGS
jgi:hypothetical protein